MGHEWGTQFLLVGQWGGCAHADGGCNRKQNSGASWKLDTELTTAANAPLVIHVLVTIITS